MTKNSLAPLVIAPTDRKKAAVRGDGPPNSTSSEIEHFLNWLGNLFEFKYDKLKEINFILKVIFYITIVNTEFMVL